MRSRINDHVFFYSTKGPYGCFSNFSLHPIMVDKKRYKTCEHYYQSCKFVPTDLLYANKIANAKTSKEAALLGRDKSRKLIRPDWEEIKIDVMRKALTHKVEQHADVKDTLLGTGYRKIIENSPSDRFWGWGRDQDGENWLGRIWMEIRAELRGETEETDDEFLDVFFAGGTPKSLIPRVWNKRKGSPAPPKGLPSVYVGRPSRWGNPFKLVCEEEREDVLRQYEEWLLSDPEKVAEVKRHLKGKHLICWCHPLACHADVLLRVANEEEEND